MVACGFSSRLVTAACLSAGRVGVLTRQARPIVTRQWNLITTPRVDACGCDRFAGFGKVVRSGGMGGGWGGVVGEAGRDVGSGGGSRGWVVGGGRYGWGSGGRDGG